MSELNEEDGQGIYWRIIWCMEKHDEYLIKENILYIKHKGREK